MSTASNFLANHPRYPLPAQDLRIDEKRLSALPKSKVVMRDVAFPRQTERERRVRADTLMATRANEPPSAD
jgi:hypothetical protein